MITKIDLSQETTKVKDKITLLRARKPSARACKIWHADSGSPLAPSIGTRFDAHAVELCDLYDFYALLKKLENRLDVFPILGQLRDPRVRVNVERKSKGKDAPFEARDHNLIAVDFDSVLWDRPIDYAQPQATVDQFLDTIPQLRDTLVVWQVTGSWGVKPGLRLRIVVWSATPLSLAQMRSFALSLPYPVDTSIYKAVMPIYTARPVFEQGAVDPCPGPRHGIREGDIKDIYAPTGTCFDELSYWQSRIEALDGSTPRHAIINKAAYYLGGWVASGSIDADHVVESLLDSCEKSNAFDAERLSDARDEISRALADGQTKPRIDASWRADLIYSETGALKNTVSNALLFVRNHPAIQGRLRFNVRRDRIEWTHKPPWDATEIAYPRRVTDQDGVECAAWLNNNGMHAVAKTIAMQVLDTASHAVQYDAVREYLDQLPAWDGVTRVETLFTDFCGCDDNAITRAIARCFCVSAVARVYEPGCKHEIVPVLYGPQGTYKSTFWRVLSTGPGESYFTDSIGDFRDVRAWVETTQGVWFAEDPEMWRSSSRENEAVKRLISAQCDVVRPAYAACAREYPRRNVIVGTTNNDTPLTDDDNRRWFVLKIKNIRIDELRQQREQIWAEAVLMFKNKVQRFLNAKEASDQRVAQSVYQQKEDAWEDLILNWAEGRGVLQLKDVLMDCLQVSRDKINRRDEMRCARILKNNGYERVSLMLKGRKTWVYRTRG